MTRPMSTAPKDRPINVRLSHGGTTVAEWTLAGWSVSVHKDDDRPIELVRWYE